MAAPGLALAADRLLAHCACAVLCLLLDAVLPISAQNVDLGPVSFAGVVDEDVTKKWWFWLIIGLIAAFMIVAGYFAWRGFRQWKKQHAIEVAEDEAREKAAAEGKAGRPRVAVVPVSAGGAGRTGDLELGMVGVQPPAPGEPLSEEQAEWLRERERRTASHQKRKW
ncbi:hypothetical protein ACK3TF_002690 [Chlorella vulgaris]